MGTDNGDEFEQRGRKHRRRTPYAAPREPRPIDAMQLQELAIGYAARYATTGAKLRRYLKRKLSERAWTPPDAPDIDGLVKRIIALGYVDDRAYAAAKQRDLTARGFGAGRVRQALAAAGISREDADRVVDADEDTSADPYSPAIAFARRRHLGPFARQGQPLDPTQRHDRLRRELAAMARAGHSFEVARRVLMAADEAAAAALTER